MTDANTMVDDFDLDEDGEDAWEEPAEEAGPKESSDRGRRPFVTHPRRIIERYLILAGDATSPDTLARLAKILRVPADPVDVTEAIFSGRVDVRPLLLARQFVTMVAESPMRAGMAIMGLEQAQRKDLWRALEAFGWADGRLPRAELKASEAIAAALQAHVLDIAVVDDTVAQLEVR